MYFAKPSIEAIGKLRKSERTDDQTIYSDMPDDNIFSLNSGPYFGACLSFSDS